MSASKPTLDAIALETLEQIAAAYDAPSMGYENGTDWETIIVERQAKKYDVPVEWLIRAISDLEHANEGPYGRNE